MTGISPAYTTPQQRHGVPLDYVGEKPGHAIEELHRFAHHHPQQRQALLAPKHYLLVAHLGLHNMLAKANDRSLALRLLEGSEAELRSWLALIERDGDVAGLAGLDEPRAKTGMRQQWHIQPGTAGPRLPCRTAASMAAAARAARGPSRPRNSFSAAASCS